MKRQIPFAVLLAAFLTTLSGCAGAEGKVAGINYPMKAGAVWEYQIIRSQKPPQYNMRAVLTNLPQRRVKGTMVTPQRLVVQGGKPGTRIKSYLLAENASGLFGFMEDNRTRTGFSPTYYVMKNPMQAGTTWESEIGELWLDESIGRLQRIVHTVESTNDTITTKAGTFEGCVKIRVNIYLKPRGRSDSAPLNMFLELSSSSHGIDTGIESYQWFAPGVGMVKATYRQGNQESATVQLQAYQL